MYRVWMVLPVLLILGSVAAAAETGGDVGGSGGIPVTRWASPHGERPLSFQEWWAAQPSQDGFSLGRVYLTSPRAAPEVDVVVNSELYPDIEYPLMEWVEGLESWGYVIAVDTASGTQGIPACEELRAHFAAQHAAGVDGVVLVGDLPVPWFQMIDEFEGDGLRSDYEEFPIDLYYMDIDGEWADEQHYDPVGQQMVPGPDGIFDTHTGTMEPEIWMGRLTAGPLGDEVSLLTNYLAKVHAFRTGGLSLTERALVYVDDDWMPWAVDWAGDVGLAYPDQVLIYDAEQTTAPDYRVRLVENYEWIAVHAHSWPGGHGFKYNNGQSWSWIYAYEIPTIDPLALFYNLFACSNARYVESGYMGGEYTFAPTRGLGAVGSTKTGSMLEFDDFYGPLGEGKEIGEALRAWFEAQIEGGFEMWEKSWYYGMTFIGDPTLRPQPPAVTVALAPEAVELTPGQTLTYVATVVNHADTSATIIGYADLTLPNGNPYQQNPVFGPLTINLGPNETKSRTIQHVIPLGAPSGLYRYEGIAEAVSGGEIDRDDFEFTVSTVPGETR